MGSEYNIHVRYRHM